jgi:acetyl esterase/lipase
MKIALTSLFVLFSLSMFAQDSLFIWPQEVPNSNKVDMEEKFIKTNLLRVSNVTKPTLSVYLPPVEKANGASVIICPGGGYHILAIEHEGYQLAEWFNSFGVTAFVLKYRLPDDVIMEDRTIGPLQDVQQSIRLVREGAKKWNLDPQKIGVMGFSAGGHLASTAATHFEDPVPPANSTSVKPNFNILIYPVVSFKEAFAHRGSRDKLLGKKMNDYNMVEHYSNELHVTKETSPTFLVHASDDKAVPVENSIRFYQALIENNVPTEMHIYQSGGHGFGMGKAGTPAASWPARLKEWMAGINLL